MATFLLEIGTEELPADFVRLAQPQLQAIVARDLQEARLACDAIRTGGTPRRLAVTVTGLPRQQEDLVEDRKGPPAQQAFRDGQPTQAAMGFARRCGCSPDQLEIRDTDKGPFVFARTTEAGRPTAEVLVGCIPGWIRSLQGRRFMRWGAGDGRFSRPLRWLVALLDEAVVPVALSDVDPPLASDRLSRGHRLHPGTVTIPSAAGYAAALEAADVQVDREARGAAIRTALQAGATAAGAELDLPEALFDELVDLVESPRLIEGSIDTDYLALPPEVLSTVMRSHQRYVPLRLANAAADPLALEAGEALMPRFLCLSNGLAAAADTIRRGNERVLRARLADAAFFLAADRRQSSAERVEALDRVTFAEGLGSLADRSQRLAWLADRLCRRLPLADTAAVAARRAAPLCKHDLVSQMVGEFPELQGVMGAKYLLAEGESRAVALAVLEHYQPRGAGDALPGSEAGAVLALAERLELLLSIFARGERPSGSSDPYALRRAGNGVLQILWDRDWSLDLVALMAEATAHWQPLLPELEVQPLTLAADLLDFLRQRLASLLEEEGFGADLVQAVAGDGVSLERLLRDPADARARVELLRRLRSEGSLPLVQAVVQRASRLAEQADLAADQVNPQGVVDPALFASPSESAVLAVLERLGVHAAASGTGRYEPLARLLGESGTTLAAFFDGPDSVMVLCDEPEVRRNRLRLLAVLRNQASELADFSRLGG
ncbi:glycine--tRNA ligase subunit beta [Cyanobium sp. Candia 9D4]|uniref:glycine--tRNA ligase subunit beta n=1 Tax=Cyanobium sp. Candia 9D4 TaxID=2823707 RepID=UPI0020CC8406|nr:glycine--tRNA ligase subunit beta [Cyanobium sp. Candia 9D4]MCP9932894.1 glycine--tRNA ligase subunit beta [Cyanobium sp. Candia 9D4]